MKSHEKKDDKKIILNVRLVILEKLRYFGLTDRESKIYIYLSNSGPKKAKEISNSEKIPRTRTYRILSQLEQKGVVATLNDKPKKFFAHPIEIAVDSLIQFEYQKISEMHKTKKVLIPLWNQAKKIQKHNNQKFIDVESKMRRYADSQKFREDFRQSLKHLLSKSDKRYRN